MALTLPRFLHRNTPEAWAPFRSIPIKRLSRLFLAVFFLFCIFGFFGDLMVGGRTAYPAVLASAFYSGINAAAWSIIMSRRPRYGLTLLIFAQVPLIWFGSHLTNLIQNHFHLQPMPPGAGIPFAAIGSVTVVMVSYGFFISFIKNEGKESFRIRNELELAHGIQKTLVPPIHQRTSQFEVYGRSDPSDKVGGDLVDIVLLDDGSAIAYLADIAGHGLQAGILMGMLKTAARTALIDASTMKPETVLPSLMGRLNRVLPSVKEAQLYATFAGFRLNADGSIFYALAAHPPILHYQANGVPRYLSAEQFPIGLLPVDDFTSEAATSTSGDLFIALTDGIIEACSKEQEEFGFDRVQAVIAGHATRSLPVLADAILTSARAFGRQIDDQTLLLIRRL
jgi:serine phosphatase RsbU (regulator of sigma subunit)